MASVDLDQIRALLIAQTAEPEPQAKGLFGRLRARRDRREPPPPPMRAVAKPTFDDADQVLLLDALFGPAVEGLEVEAASALPPPPPRSGFGRRADGAAEVELMLETPAAPARRLRTLHDADTASGARIVLEEPSLRPAYEAVDDAHAAPYFPEDLMEPGAPLEPQPLRPWIKALRNTGVAKPPAASPAAAPILDQSLDEDAPLVKRVRNRRVAKQPPKPKPSTTLGQDLLEALVLTLAREHDALVDRLLAVASDQRFHQEMMAGVEAA